MKMIYVAGRQCLKDDTIEDEILLAAPVRTFEDEFLQGSNLEASQKYYFIK